jgi:hypothetical protein
MIANCGHPELPVFALPMHSSSLDTPYSQHAEHLNVESLHELLPVVHAGDIIRFWRQEDHLRIEVAGIAEESGTLGKAVHVRLLRSSASVEQVEQQFVGLVRGPSDVEMQQ